MNQSPGIYRLKMEMGETSRVYIGQSVNIRARILQHLSSLKGNRHPNKFLQNSYNKYGDSNLKIEVLEYLETRDEDSLTAAETFWIVACKSLDPKYGFNLKEAGHGGSPSEETKGKISAAMKGKSKTEEHIRKVAESQTGKKRGPRKAEHIEATASKLRGQTRSPESIERYKKAWEVRKQQAEASLKIEKITKVNLLNLI